MIPHRPGAARQQVAHAPRPREGRRAVRRDRAAGAGPRAKWKRESSKPRSALGRSGDRPGFRDSGELSALCRDIELISNGIVTVNAVDNEAMAGSRYNSGHISTVTQRSVVDRPGHDRRGPPPDGCAGPVLAVQVRQRPGHLQDPVEAARRKPHRVGGVVDQRSPFGIGLRDLFDHGRRTGGIGGDPRTGRGRRSAGPAARGRLQPASRPPPSLRSGAAGSGRTRSRPGPRSTDRSGRAAAPTSAPGIAPCSARSVAARQTKPGSVAWPQRQGFIAATSWKRAG